MPRSLDNPGVLVPEKRRNVVERLGHVLHTEVGNPLKGNPEGLLHHFGKLDGCPRALDQVQSGAVRPHDVFDATVPGYVGDGLDAHFFEVIPDDPKLSGQVEVPEDIDAKGRDARGIPRSDQPEHGFAGGAVPLALVSLEPLGLNRNNRDLLFRGDPPANRLQIVSDDADDAGRIDECRLRLMALYQFCERAVKFFLATEDDIYFLQVG